MRLIYDADKERLELALTKIASPGNDREGAYALIEQVLANMKELESSVHRSLEVKP